MADQNNRDLVLAPNQFANVMDKTKGNMTVFVGAHKATISPASDLPVRYDPDTRKWIQCDQDSAIQEFPLAKEGEYIVLQNPAAPNAMQHPKTGQAQGQVEVLHGRHVNIHGP